VERWSKATPGSNPGDPGKSKAGTRILL
jgi:hypothetical protein